MKKILALLLAMTMVFGMAACGSSDTQEPAAENNASNAENAGTDTAEETTGTETAGDEATDAESAGTLTTVTDGVLTMSTNAAFPPYEMTDDNGNVIGIDADIAAAIAEKLGLELEILDMDFDAALLAVQQGKSDMVMAGVTVNEDRLAVMDFSETYANGVQVIITQEGSDVTIDNLGEKMIGTQRGTTGNIYCTDDYGEEHVIAYDNGITAVQALVNGQIDCVVIDKAPAESFVTANPGLTILDTEYVTEDYAIGFAKGNTALVDAVNGALNELIEDGTVQSIVDTYITAE
ncbi:MAG TPA: amino acid ABC transporter substrate-binding protein [Candidatus Avoscillospira avistercoris]|uniref:Amino acid ABC transporter substrate-binding protein n=1 Tax=Candidatus Avoscillospira avistercoris TaxID=2840707 RepID=A0A9D1F9I4_9FIRM|nr:amino acid ABC transporter substrate-binding protein [Candidatus Avoscillospira avistercoris]